jgi:hypothetical protein
MDDFFHVHSFNTAETIVSIWYDFLILRHFEMILDVEMGEIN